MNSSKGTFIVLDGIDGSGKSSIIKTWADHLSSQGKKVFSLKTYWTEHHTHPTVEEVASYDVILSAEPTTVWAGAAIRQEMIQSGSTYSATAIADAYALDRLTLYKRLILPLLDQGKIILQDRSVSTSLCYQPLQDTSLSMAQVAEREGNKFALSHAPRHLILVDVSPETALNRLGGRHEKKDNALFEQESFLTQARERFLDPAYQAYFTNEGTNIHTLNAEADFAIIQTQAIQLLDRLLSS